MGMIQDILYASVGSGLIMLGIAFFLLGYGNGLDRPDVQLFEYGLGAVMCIAGVGVILIGFATQIKL